MFAEPGLPGLSCDTKESRDSIVLSAGSDYYNTDTCWAQCSVLVVQTPVMIILWKKSNAVLLWWLEDAKRNLRSMKSFTVTDELWAIN